MLEVEFLPAAEAEYREALAWYEERSPQATAGFEVAVEEAVNAIGEHPDRWAARDKQHRFFALGRYTYSIIYRKLGDRVQVVAVAHARRKPS